METAASRAQTIKKLHVWVVVIVVALALHVAEGLKLLLQGGTLFLERQILLVHDGEF